MATVQGATERVGEEVKEVAGSQLQKAFVGQSKPPLFSLKYTQHKILPFLSV